MLKNIFHFLGIVIVCGKFIFPIQFSLKIKHRKENNWICIFIFSVLIFVSCQIVLYFLFIFYFFFIIFFCILLISICLKNIFLVSFGLRRLCGCFSPELFWLFFSHFNLVFQFSVFPANMVAHACACQFGRQQIRFEFSWHFFNFVIILV